MEIGVVQSMEDPCMPRKFSIGEPEVMLVVVHVDGILACNNGTAGSNLFKNQRATKLSIKDLGEASFYMSCHINHNRAKTLTVDQHGYLQTIVFRPLSAGLKLRMKAPYRRQ